MKDLSFAKSLILVAAAPYLAAAVFVVEGLKQDLREVRDAEVVRDLVSMTGELSGLVHELQRERGTSSGFLASGGRVFTEELEAQRLATDSRRAAFETALGAGDLTTDPRFSGAAMPVLSDLQKLGRHRAQITAQEISRDAAVDFYTRLNNRSFSLIEAVARSTAGLDTQDHLRALKFFMEAKDLVGLERAVGASGFAAGRFTPDQRRRLTELESRSRVLFQLAGAFGGLPLQEGLREIAASGAAAERDALVSRALDPGQEIDGIAPERWWTSATRHIDDLKATEDRLLAELALEADRRLAASRNSLHLHVALLAVSGGAALLLSLATILTVRNRFAATLQATQKLAAGEFSTTIPPEGGSEFGRLNAALRKLRDDAGAARQTTADAETARDMAARENQLLGEINEWLQASQTLDELYDMVRAFMAALFSDCSGSLYIYSNSRDVLDGACSWNDGAALPHIRPNDCWALRRGRSYLYGTGGLEFRCDHADSESADAALTACLPILAHGETVGLLHLATGIGSLESFQETRRLAQLCAEQISLAVANVRLRDQLHDRSIRDPLTGMFNRRHFTETLRGQIEAARRSLSPVSVVSLDIDHFKKFNDNFGHDAGDTVLRAVATAIEKNVDGNEIACRLGGEELVILLPGADLETAFARAEAVRADIGQISIRYGEKTLPSISVSAGVAEAPKHGDSVAEVMNAADAALYRAKAGGRNQTRRASAEDLQMLPAEVAPTLDTDLSLVERSA